MKDLKRENSIRRFRILEVMDLVLKINEFAEEKKPTLLLNFIGQQCGHEEEILAGMVMVTYYEHGWTRDGKPDMEKRASMDCEEAVEDLIEALFKILAEKEKLLRQ